jgi:modulator of FtsH protease
MRPAVHRDTVAYASRADGVAAAASTNAVLRNTYWLLGLTLLLAAITASVTAALELPYPGIVVTLVGYFGLLFLTSKLRNSNWGLLSVFALTGFMGYTLGPIIAAYLAMPRGAETVATAMGATAVVFLGLSAYARSTRAVNLMKLGTFLFVGVLTAFVLGLAAIFFELPALSLAVSGLFVLLMSGVIVYETQNILAGGETNYIMATVSLFVAIFNLFTSLLHLLGALNDD